MNPQSISFDQLMVRSHDLWANKWMLLTCGDFLDGSYNCMTIAWGSLGNIWNRPFAQVMVRPSRLTFRYMEKYDSFTLCAFPDEYRRSLEMLGSVSGRTADKLNEAGLTPIASSIVAAPSFSEAELILECKNIYWNDVDPSHFMDDSIMRYYPDKDYHRIYYGEVIAIVGES